MAAVATPRDVTAPPRDGAAPEPERVEFLAYGECECGWRCACPEGSKWPNCPSCGSLVFPVRSSAPGYGYVAELYDEITAVHEAARRGRSRRSEPRLYAPALIRADARRTAAINSMLAGCNADVVPEWRRDALREAGWR